MSPAFRSALGRSLASFAALAASVYFCVSNLPVSDSSRTAEVPNGKYAISELVYMGATHTFSYLGFNQKAHVSGSLWGKNAKYAAALYDGKDLVAIGTLPGDSGSRVYGMNDEDVVVGGSYKYDNLYWMRTTHGFVWDGKTLVDLKPLPGQPCSRAWSVNNGGLVVGNSYRPLNEQRDAISLPVKWERGLVERLPLPSGATDGIAYSVNDAGDIAGNVTLADRTTRACLWRGSSIEILPPLDGDKSTSTPSINQHGVVLAVSQGDKARIVIWDHESKRTIDGIPGVSRLQPVQINDSGAFIANDPDTPGYPFLWEPGKGFSRVSHLINSHSGYSIWKALGLNDRGQIAVGGRYRGVRSSVFLVSPSGVTVSPKRGPS